MNETIEQGLREFHIAPWWIFRQKPTKQLYRCIPNIPNVNNSMWNWTITLYHWCQWYKSKVVFGSQSSLILPIWWSDDGSSFFVLQKQKYYSRVHLLRGNSQEKKKERRNTAVNSSSAFHVLLKTYPWIISHILPIKKASWNFHQRNSGQLFPA